MLRTAGEDVCEFDYRPGNCKRDYRVVALRKDLSVERGEDVLFHEYRWFFYITNLKGETTSADGVVMEARQRCDQENLISQLKGQVRALHAPVNTLMANWAYMVMAVPRLEHEGLVRPAPAGVAPLGEDPRGAAPAAAHDGVQDVPSGLH